MFKCKTCGIVKPKVTKHSIVTQIRKVSYTLQAQFEKRGKRTEDGLEIPTIELETKILKQSNGTEIVKEDIYCAKCLPKIVTPKLVGSAARIQTIKAKKQDRSRGKSKRS